MRRNLLHAVVRHVADDDMVPRSRLEVDIVDTNAVTHDHLQVGQCGEHALRKRRVLVDDCRVAWQVLDQIIFGFALKEHVV
ncbi:hypothetical protein SDC9_165544 [bioreactor metagenome]|uniref:Uncharacterized protein n=1 Tax=bioreactor metagenome TaxID=1076179 RepID=A0A645FWF6_9ZZZZ